VLWNNTEIEINRRNFESHHISQLAALGFTPSEIGYLSNYMALAVKHYLSRNDYTNDDKLKYIRDDKYEGINPWYGL
jgi:hypothetical protein